jgi:hypothetical protein
LNIIKRFQPKHDWPVLIAGVMLLAFLWFVFSADYETPRYYRPRLDEVVNYADLLSRYSRTSPDWLLAIPLAWIILITIGLSSGTKLARRTALSLVALALIGVCYFCANLFIHLAFVTTTKMKQLEQLTVNSQLYNLALVEIRHGDPGWSEYNYVVYRCETSEEICHTTYVEEDFSYGYNRPVIDLVFDTSTNRLQLAVNNEVVFTEEAGE